MSYIIGGNYGALRPDLTPFDLQLAGFTIRTHGEGWCWWLRLRRGGEWYGACHDTVAEAVADARWLMTGRAGQQGAQWVLVGLG